MIRLEKGNSIDLTKKGEKSGPFHATLKWRTSVDLDLHCFYKLKEQPAQAQGFFKKIAQAASGSGKQEGQICFINKGSANRAPWISLDKDSGVGDVGGNNEENMHFHDINKLEHAIIVANIYNKTTNFAQYSAFVIVKGGGNSFEVPLSETNTGSWCVVARIDNSSGTPRLINVNQTVRNEPRLIDYIR